MARRYIIILLTILASIQTMYAEKIEDRQGWVWEYADYSFQYDGISYHYMRIGDEVEICGKQYSCFKHFKTIQTHYTDWENHYQEIVYTKEGDLHTTFFREEGNQTYIPIYKHDDRYGYPIYDCLKCEGDLTSDFIDQLKENKILDVKIYDYDLPDSEIWEYPDIKEEMSSIQFYPIRVKLWDPIHINKIPCKVMTLWGIKFIENIGILFNGMYTMPIIDEMTGSAPDNLNFPGYQTGLNRVFDKDGNVIWHDESTLDPYYNSLRDIVENKNTFSTCYDIHGYPISYPLPGTVFIRDGKKLVAR